MTIVFKIMQLTFKSDTIVNLFSCLLHAMFESIYIYDAFCVKHSVMYLRCEMSLWRQLEYFCLCYVVVMSISDCTLVWLLMAGISVCM